MKHSFFCILLFFSPFLTAEVTHYRTYAKQWTKKYIRKSNGTLRISDNELMHIKALIESSLQRAQTTLNTQQYMWQSMSIFWKGWQNLTQTRLNPSHARPYLITDEEKDNTQYFWNKLDFYDQVCDAYNLTVQQVVYGDLLSTILAKEAVASMRSEARVCMVNALADVKKNLELLYNITFKESPHDMVRIFESYQEKGLNLVAFLLDYVPNLAMHKFIQADALYTSLSEDGWTILEKIQLIGKQAWDAIEIARSEFYQALLDALVDL